jgi:hypothetical protein
MSAALSCITIQLMLELPKPGRKTVIRGSHTAILSFQKFSKTNSIYLKTLGERLIHGVVQKSFDWLDPPLTHVPASHTMFEHIRSIAVVAGVLAVAACGGGDSGSGGAGTCTNGTMSSPGTPTDPCASSQTTCAASATQAVSLCASGSWGQCMCTPTAASAANAATGGPKKGCGDGTVQPELGEMCEMSQPAPTCATLMPGSTGIVNCVDCKYDTKLCTVMMKASTGGTGAATGGTGAMSTGGTGARK